jgi:hypothetical protein
MFPLSVKTMIPRRTDRSIMKVIFVLWDQVNHGVAALLPFAISADKDATRRPHTKD